MKRIVLFTLAIVASYAALWAQPKPVLSGTLKAGGVQSRNFEMIGKVAFRPGSGDQFYETTVPYMDGTTPRKKKLLVTVVNELDADKNNRIRLIDVTNPRSANDEYLTFTLNNNTGNESQGTRSKFEWTVAYTDELSATTGTYNGDVFLVAFVHNLVVNAASPATTARFVIINLSKAVALRETGTTPLIEIYDGGLRDVKYAGAVTGNSDVYVGYIATDGTYGIDDPHTLGVDQKSGVLTLPLLFPVKDGSGVYHAYVDMFDLATITTACTPSTTPVLGVLNRIEMASNKPIEIPKIGTDNKLAYPHDVVPQYLSSKKVRLFLGSTTNGVYAADPKYQSTVTTPKDQAGGVVIVDVDYSTATAATVSTPVYWPYDMDRNSPASQFSSDAGWKYRQAHTAAPFVHTGETATSFVLTADEFARARYNTTDGNKTQMQPEPSHALTTSSGAWTGGVDPIIYNAVMTYNSTYGIYQPSGSEDNRRLGAYLRVWNTSTSSGGALSIIGTGSNAGPFGMYDPIESTEPENLYFASRKTLPSSGGIATSCTASSSEDVGPSTVHRVHTISQYDGSMFSRNNNDVFLTAYAAGCRVINLGSTATDGVVLEKGFFDFIPTLNYNKTSEYFYRLSSGGCDQLESTGSEHRYMALNNIGMYFMGVWHTVPDFGTSRVGTDGTGSLPEDEKFVYVMGFGEGKVVASTSVSDYAVDPSAVTSTDGRNWIPQGGYLLLRYFDGKLGGEIKGYVGTDGWSNKSYRTVNLQGPFTVERDVTIAAGTTVNLLAGHSGDPGVFEATSITASSGKKIIVEGNLVISVEDGDTKGTDIIIDSPIEVRDGGCLIINKIKDGKKVQFKQAIVVKSGGTWKFNPKSNVELYYKDHECDGHFRVDGTRDERVVITSRRSGSDFSQSAYINGKGTSDFEKSRIQIAYADVANTCIRLESVTSRTAIPAISNSTFTLTRAGENELWEIFRLTKPLSTLGTNRRAQVLVKDSRFTDATTGYAARESHHSALFIADASACKLTNLEIDNFKTGTFALNNDGVYVQGCDVKNSQTGIYVNSGTASVCNSTFTNNEFSWVIYGSGSAYYRDNTFTSCVKGVSATACGRQFLRNNTFSGYHSGLSSWTSTLMLRNEERPGDNYEFGRNHFNGAVNTTTTPAYATADISLKFKAELIVDCGYNKFSEYSDYHVAHDNDGVAHALNVDHNEWSPGANYIPRLAYMTYTGVTRNVSQTVDPSCTNVVNNEVCGTVVCPSSGAGAYLELDGTDSTLQAARVAIRADVQDTNLPWKCRKDKAWEYYEVVRLIDSSAFRTTLKSDMKDIFKQTTLDTTFRSTALLIKALTHVRMEEYDSAKYVWNTITSNFPNTADSVVGHWMSMYVDIVTDTLNRKDTLTRAYNDRIVMDLRNRMTLPSISLYKSGSDHRSEGVHEVMDDVSPGSPARPNPTVSGTVSLDFLSATSVRCFIDVVDVQGIVQSSFEQSLHIGQNDIVVQTVSLAPGTYVAKVRCSDFVHSVPFVVTR